MPTLVIAGVVAGVLLGVLSTLLFQGVYRRGDRRSPATRQQLARARRANRLALPRTRYASRWLAGPRDDFESERI